DLPLVYIDPVLIEQVLINLLDNAVKYSPADSIIQINAQLVENQLNVEVVNSGSRIDETEEAKLFDKFFRGKGSEESAGAGLGLAICKGFVAAHGGIIRAENRSKDRVAFLFTVPIPSEPPSVECEAEFEGGTLPGAHVDGKMKPLKKTTGERESEKVI
ncbi:MAG TPA: ATP-binding protein, partial [Chroococcales cyanobacterium]